MATVVVVVVVGVRLVLDDADVVDDVGGAVDVVADAARSRQSSSTGKPTITCNARSASSTVTARLWSTSHSHGSHVTARTAARSM